MKIVLAPDSFKGTFSSIQMIEMLEEGCKVHFPEAEIVKIPMADGGEGTVEAFIEVLNFTKMTVPVKGPMGTVVQATLAMKEDVAVIEMAQASGLHLVEAYHRDPSIASTYGTGELIKNALDAGAKRILIGLGGSATNDGGTGMAQALGVKFLDESGAPLLGCGKQLGNIKQIDSSGIDHRLSSCEVLAICDVTNPLTGPLGATRVYGTQKNADTQMINRLEEGMINYKMCLMQHSGIDPDKIPGSGAAGGLGAAIAILLGGKLLSGIDAILDAIDFESLIKDADLIITGEGRLDAQSLFGKVPIGIARRCRNHKAWVFVLAGSISGDLNAFYESGIDGVYPVITEPFTLEEALKDPQKKMHVAIDHMLRLIKAKTDVNAC